MKHLHYLLITLAGVFILTGCVTHRKVNLMQDPSRDVPAYDDTLSYEDYLLRKGDRLYIHVYSIDQKTATLLNSNLGGGGYGNNVMRNGAGGYLSDLYTYVVDEDGAITFPTIGKQYVRGLTTRQVKYLLEDHLSGLVKTLGNQSMLSVDVQVVQRSFSIIGPTKSGRYNLTKEKVTVFEALALAGDLGDLSSRRDVMLIREIEDSTIVKTFDLRSKDIINSEFYYIEPNDVLYIRYLRGYSFGLNHVTATFGLVSSTISFSVFIYTMVNRLVTTVQNATKKGEGDQ